MGTPAIDVSITITTCSRRELLRQTLEILLPQAQAAPFRAEFVIVDDRSTDDTAQVLQDFQRRADLPVTLVAGPGIGISAARNLQLRHSRGRWIACCDDDQIAHPGWLQGLYDAALRSSADFVGGSMDLHLPSGVSRNGFGPRARRLLGEVGLNQPEGAFAPGHYPATNNVLMLAEAVRKLGGFNPGLGEGGEDRDLFQRAAAAGYTLWFTPAARMRHILSERRVSPESLRWTAIRIGSGDTRMLHLGGKSMAAFVHAVRRSTVLALRDLPQLAAARILCKRVAELDVLCSVWYTHGVLRSLTVLLQPNADRSRAFLKSMDFRSRDGERTA